MRKTTPGLESLIAPFSLSKFLTHHWPRKHFVIHGGRKTVKPLLELPQLQSIDALVESWPDKVLVNLPDFDDEKNSISMNQNDARKLYDSNLNLIFLSPEEHFPSIGIWLDKIRKDLSMTLAARPRCIVYASPNGKGAKPHFDQNTNFILQVKGQKRWFLAPNKNVTYPLTRHVMNSKVPVDLLPYSQLPFPKKMPKDSIEIVLKPGSLLFLPRGLWHTTEAMGESISLNFTFTPPTWIHYLISALTNQLSSDVRWRDTADGITSANSKTKKEALQKFSGLLRSLSEELKNADAKDLLLNSENRKVRYRRRPTSKVSIGAKVVSVRSQGGLVKLELDKPLRSLLIWICRNRSLFDSSDIINRFHELDTEERVSYALESLVEADIIEPVIDRV